MPFHSLLLTPLLLILYFRDLAKKMTKKKVSVGKQVEKRDELRERERERERERDEINTWTCRRVRKREVHFRQRRVGILCTFDSKSILRPTFPIGVLAYAWRVWVKKRAGGIA